MSYTTREAVANRRGTLPLEAYGDADADGAEDPARVAATILEVDALIDGALVSRWPSAVGTAAPLLGMIAVDLVIDRLAVGLARTLEIEEAGRAAMRRLLDIAEGRLDPRPPEPGGAVAPERAGSARAWVGDQPLTRAALGRVL
ncbi:phage protein Gp36 family protein [Lamprocystis purpurea]|jgi:phage gp36-like protein|uniref:phage protein Gp36 family protein n=1 Tax=Lamprocystis purpurea TaxID=61598 RepID=UPI0003798176|nr:phage protein Gp36 family protein [Lamprocystis purpurea]